MGRRILLAAAVAALMIGGAPAVVAADDASAFVTTIEDLPLMPGLSEDVAAGVAFDSPAGRIVEAYATGNVDRSRVLEFYAAALPQLGWRQDGAGVFVREHEILKVEFPLPPQPGKPLTVRFAVAPATE